MRKQIKCKYIFDEDYNPKYINGAQGGINLQGEIVASFYFERAALPISQTYELNEKGAVISELETEPTDLNDSFVRVIENGIIMNYQTAKEIHKWLGEHLKKLEEITTKE